MSLASWKDLAMCSGEATIFRISFLQVFRVWFRRKEDCGPSSKKGGGEGRLGKDRGMEKSPSPHNPGHHTSPCNSSLLTK